MGVGAAVSGHHDAGFLQFVDPNRKWYNNRRLIALNGWIVLLSVLSHHPRVLSESSPLCSPQPHHILHKRL